MCRFGSEFGRLCPLADVGLIAQTWQSVKVTALSTVAVADAGRDKSMLRVGDKVWVYIHLPRCCLEVPQRCSLHLWSQAHYKLDGFFTSKPPTHKVCEVQRRCEHIQTSGRQQCVMEDEATAATTMMIRNLTCTNWNDPCWHVSCLWLDRELAVSWRNCMTVCARLWFL